MPFIAITDWTGVKTVRVRDRHETAPLAQAFRRGARIALNLAAIVACITSPLSVQAKSPNVVLVMADDLGWRDLSYHGSEIETPHIDRMADTGLALERFYVQPTCSPTRAAVMTGKSAARLGVFRPISKVEPRGLPLDETLLPELFAEAGYQTVMAGKWHLGHVEKRYFPHARGFEEFYGHVTGGIGYWDHNHGGGHDWQRNGKTLREDGYATHLIVDEALKQIEDRDPNRPLFLFVSFNAPHLPNEAPTDRIDGYSETMDPHRRIHAAMVSELDAGVGRILAALDSEGIREETIVWFFSDNGGLNRSASPAGLNRWIDRLADLFGQPLPVDFLEFVRKNIEEGGADNAPLRAGKGSVYEGGIRVPSILSWPGRLLPGESNAFVTAQDVLPTLLEAAGLSAQIPQDLDGADRWEAIREDEFSGPNPDSVGTFRVEGLGGVALVRPPWKLVVTGSPLPWSEPTSELFHLEDDPSEETNLAARYPETVRELQIALDAQAVGPSIHGSVFWTLLDPDSFGGPEDRGPWAEAAR